MVSLLNMRICALFQQPASDPFIYFVRVGNSNCNFHLTRSFDSFKHSLIEVSVLIPMLFFPGSYIEAMQLN